jgi:hypothetical protein
MGIMDKKNNTTDHTMEGEWPNGVRTRDELESALEAGEKSGVSKRTIDEIFESGIAKAKNS